MTAKVTTETICDKCGSGIPPDEPHWLVTTKDGRKAGDQLPSGAFPSEMHVCIVCAPDVLGDLVRNATAPERPTVAGLAPGAALLDDNELEEIRLLISDDLAPEASLAAKMLGEIERLRASGPTVPSVRG